MVIIQFIFLFTSLQCLVGIGTDNVFKGKSEMSSPIFIVYDCISS